MTQKDKSLFEVYYEIGKQGGFKGLSMGPGLESLTTTMGGLQAGRIYTLASPQKTGKTTLLNYGFIFHPLMAALKMKRPIKFIYYSLEMSLIQQQFYFTTMIMAMKYGIKHYKLPANVTYKGQKIIPFTPELLMGRISDDQDRVIILSKELEELMFGVYKDYITRIFGEYNDRNEKITEGYIDIIEKADNPTGIFKYLRKYAERTGKLEKTGIGKFEKTTVYIPDNKEAMTVVVIDHVRKLLPENNMTNKEIIDQMAKYEVILRNILGFTFVNVIHLNRSFDNIERYKLLGDQLFPSSENIKDTGNLAEESDYVLTMMNPYDERFSLRTHFGLPLYQKGQKLYPGLRTIHLVDSRWTEAPLHFRTIMNGATKTFSRFEKK